MRNIQDRNRASKSPANSAADHVSRTGIRLPPGLLDSIQATKMYDLSALVGRISRAGRRFFPAVREGDVWVLHSNGRCTIRKNPLIISSNATTASPPLSLISKREAATMLTDPSTIAIWNNAAAKSKLGPRSAA